jgi:SAM-dependent methyltransferase
LDTTEEMLALARRNAAVAGVHNVEFLQGYLEDIPLPDDCVDVVISNCVLNLAADKFVVLAEAARVLRPGGRLAFSDVIADEDMDETTKADMIEWTGCIAGPSPRSSSPRRSPPRGSATSRSAPPTGCTPTPRLQSFAPPTPDRRAHRKEHP